MRWRGLFHLAFLWEAESISEKFSTWECCVCSLPVLSFCAPHTSSSSSQRSYRKDYFLGMPSSSSYSFFQPQQSCTHLPTESMWPFDNRVTRQFLLVWSYSPTITSWVLTQPLCHQWKDSLCLEREILVTTHYAVVPSSTTCTRNLISVRSFSLQWDFPNIFGGVLKQKWLRKVSLLKIMYCIMEKQVN